MLVPLKFFAVSKRDVSKSRRIPDGTLLVTAERVSKQSEVNTFRLDVECNPILRVKSMSTGVVRRIFYTIHAILDDEPDSDLWTLLFRSEPVEMIHTKRDGGSLQYNYFSSCRLFAQPGLIIDDVDGRELRKKVEKANMTSFEKVGKALGIRQRGRFFSLPGADLTVNDVDRQLKLTLFEDKGLVSGFHLIADVEFSVRQLARRDLGGCWPVKMHSNVVGKAALKYVECGDDPRYFCLSVAMQSVR